MDKFLLNRYHEIKLALPPPFYSKLSDQYIEIAGPEAVVGLCKFLGSYRHSVNTQYRYLIMQLDYKLFLEGLSPHESVDYFKTPLNTAIGHFDIFKKYPPCFKDKSLLIFPPSKK